MSNDAKAKAKADPDPKSDVAAANEANATGGARFNPVATAEGVKTPNPSAASAGGDPDAADAGLPTPGVSADAPEPVDVIAPVLDPTPGKVKAEQPGKYASGNAHQLDHVPIMGMVDHTLAATGGGFMNVHTPGVVMMPNPRQHGDEEPPPGDASADPSAKPKASAIDKDATSVQVVPKDPDVDQTPKADKPKK